MSKLPMLLLAIPVALASACKDTVGPAMDCVYDKTAASAPGYQICTPSATIQSATSPAAPPDHMNPTLPFAWPSY